MPVWTPALLALEACSPIHAGMRASGNLKQTRPYVPGRALWGAITQWRTIRANHTDYEATGVEVSRTLRFSYAFPSTSKEVVTLWPWEDPSYFDWLYLDSYASTALADGRVKEDGSLHETEFISPRTRDNRQVYMLLHMWAKDGAMPDLSFWSGFQFGGERGYGWGRIKCASFSTLPETLFGQNNGWTFREDDGEILLSPPVSKARALAHVMPSSTKWSGYAEPLIGRDTVRRLPGVQLSTAQTTYPPGCELPQSSGAAFTISPFGFWTSIALTS